MTFAYPKSPKSPLTREWLAMIHGGGGGAATTSMGTQSLDTNSIEKQQHALSTPLPLMKSSRDSHDNRSWWSFVTENASDQLEAASGVHYETPTAPTNTKVSFLSAAANVLTRPRSLSAPDVASNLPPDVNVLNSRKVRFEKSLQPPPILKSSSSYGNNNTNNQSGTLERYGRKPNNRRVSGSGGGGGSSSSDRRSSRFRNSSSSVQDEGESFLDLLQDRLCGPSDPASATSGGGGFFQVCETQIERSMMQSMNNIFGMGYGDYNEYMLSESEDTFSNDSGVVGSGGGGSGVMGAILSARTSFTSGGGSAITNGGYSSTTGGAGTNDVLSRSESGGFVSPPLSPQSLASTSPDEDDDDDDDESSSSQSFDEVFLSRDDEYYSSSKSEPSSGNKNISSGIAREEAAALASTTSSKYKNMLKQARLAKKTLSAVAGNKNDKNVESGPGVAATPLKKTSAFATFLPALKSRSNSWEPTTSHIGRMQLAEQNRPLTPTQLNAIQSAPLIKEITDGTEQNRRQHVDTKYRLLKNYLRKPTDKDDEEGGETDGERSCKENGIPLLKRGRSKTPASRGTPQDSTHVARGRERPETEAAVGAAAWVAAPAVSGLSSDDSAKLKKNAPLIILSEDPAGKSCVPIHNRFFARRRSRSFSRPRTPARKQLDRPPATITTLPLVPTEDLGTTHNTRDNNYTIPSNSTAISAPTPLFLHEHECTRHSYVAYFHRGPLRASKTIRLYEHPTPPMFPTLNYEVVVRVWVSTVTETDCRIRRGDYWGEGTQHPLHLPVVPGTAFCGTIVQMDKHTARSGFKKGDCVTSLVRVGANSRHLCIGYDRLVKVPCSIRDPAAAVCLPEVYLTAFQALHIEQRPGIRYRKNSLEGKSVLILGGGTKTGRALVELALAAGSGTVYATASEKLFKVVEETGGIPLDKDPHHWYSLLVGKMDIIVCVNCDDIQKSELKYEHIQTLSRNGRMVLLKGPEYDGEKVVELNKVDEQSKGTTRRLYHYNVFEAWEADMKQGKRDLEHLLKLLAEDVIAPKILERIPLTKIPRAQEIIQVKSLSGFLVCEPWRRGSKRGPPVDSNHSFSETLDGGPTIATATASLETPGGLLNYDRNNSLLSRRR